MSRAVDDGQFVVLDGDFGCHIPDPAEEARTELEFMYYEIFESRGYLEHGIELPQAPVVVDAGANVGLFTLFVKRERPAAKILAFEPLPPIAGCLRRNLALHRAHDVRVSTTALGAEAEDGVRFTYYPTAPGNSTRHPDQGIWSDRIATDGVESEVRAVRDRLRHTREFVVQVRSLSGVLPDHPDIDRVDLLKVDVEGAELEVLQGISAGDFARVRQVVVEVQDLDDRLAAVCDLLERQGFTVATEVADVPEYLRFHLVYATRA